MMRYFFAGTGEYLGGFDEGSMPLVPEGAIEVESPPSHGLDRLVDGVIVPYEPEKPLNERLEESFLSFLPNHLGQPYLTGELMLTIGSLKQVVTDYNRLGLYQISKGMIAGFPLPAEMQADRDAIVALYPEEV